MHKASYAFWNVTSGQAFRRGLQVSYQPTSCIEIEVERNEQSWYNHVNIFTWGARFWRNCCSSAAGGLAQQPLHCPNGCYPAWFRRNPAPGLSVTIESRPSLGDSDGPWQRLQYNPTRQRQAHHWSRKRLSELYSYHRPNNRPELYSYHRPNNRKPLVWFLFKAVQTTVIIVNARKSYSWRKRDCICLLCMFIYWKANF